MFFWHIHHLQARIKEQFIEMDAKFDDLPDNQISDVPKEADMLLIHKQIEGTDSNE